MKRLPSVRRRVATDAAAPCPFGPARPRDTRRAGAALAAMAALVAGPEALAAGSGALASQALDPPLIPVPVSAEFTGGDPFMMSGSTPILVEADDEAARWVGEFLDDLVGARLRDLLRTPAEIARLRGAPLPEGAPVRLRLVDREDLGAEGYDLRVASAGVVIEAVTAAGLFYGVQTLRQLLPARVEYEAALLRPMRVPAARVVDRPRFAWRGAMLDVARHFFGVEDVERFIDLMALYKLNMLHLHLADDQGWRIEVPGRPALTRTGAHTQVGGGAGGYYTVVDYEQIVRYAADRFITIVPEIDLPGHTNAALASIPEINCDGRARRPYTGVRVGFSTVCVEREETYAFVEDVVREISSRSPGPWFHVGGDEVRELTAGQYAAFMLRVRDIVRRHGKHMMGWDEIAEADLPLEPGAAVQVWRPQSEALAAHVAAAAAAGAWVVLSPADRIYLDMKYDATTVLGLDWAGLNDTRDAYDWDPATLVAGVPENAILGVEAPLWSETVATIRDVEYMAFPRLAGVAEIGWSPQEARDWETYRLRLGAHGPRWTALGINFHRSPLVPWGQAPP